MKNCINGVIYLTSVDNGDFYQTKINIDYCN